MITLALISVAVATNTNLKQLFCCALAISDGMAIFCLFMVSKIRCFYCKEPVHAVHVFL